MKEKDFFAVVSALTQYIEEADKMIVQLNKGEDEKDESSK